MVIDLSARKGLPSHPEWYPGAQVVKERPGAADISAFLDGLDVVLCCETPMSYELFSMARQCGIRTIMQLNFEFLDYWQNPHLPKPTVFAAASPWNVHRMSGRVGEALFPVVWDLPVPVDPESIPQRVITEAKTFLHIGGRPAAHDRNGTLDFLALAASCADLGASWVVTCQSPTDDIRRALRDAHRAGAQVETIGDVPAASGLYAQGDVMILPRRFGGLCMPCLEALTAGMPVVMPAIDPNTTWLPKDWLVPASNAGTFRAKTSIDLYQVDMACLESLVRRLHATPALVAEWATTARQIAQQWTWDALLPRYQDVLNRVMELKP